MINRVKSVYELDESKPRTCVCTVKENGAEHQGVLPIAVDPSKINYLLPETVCENPVCDKMCHNSNKQSAQIEKFVENGMPQKIVKTVQQTLRKRAEESKKELETSVDRIAILETTSPSPSTFALNSNPLVEETPRDGLPPSRNGTLEIPKLCGRFRQVQEKIANIGGNIDADVGSQGTAYVDALAVATQLTKQFAQLVSSLIEKMQHSRIYTLFTKTTQPAHFIAVCILSFVLLTVWPHNSDDIPSTDADAVGPRREKTNTLAAIAYLGAFATHFGAQIWMTFVSGLSLYFSLPRHTFGQCQQILFPKYFALNSVLSVSMLILFVKYLERNWNLSGWVQVVALSLSAVIEVTVRLYLAPPMLHLMLEKYKIEGSIGSGHEVGNLVQGDLVQCPHYQRIHKAFRRIHMTVAIGNIVVLLATCLHLYFLALKIQIS